MAKRRFNWTVVIVFVIALVVLAVTAFSLRKWQVTRMGSKALESGLKAYENCHWDAAAENLGHYLSINPSDVEILLKYAEAQLNRRPLKRNHIQQAIAAYRGVLRVKKNNITATDKLVSLYLQMNIPTEAELIAKRYLQENESADIRRMLAISLAGQRRFKEAASQLQAVIEKHPELVAAYETLGLLSERYPEDFPNTAEHWFNEAVKNNPASAHAFIIRATFYLRNRETAKALFDLEKAEGMDLSDLAVHLRLATEFSNANDLEKAKVHLAQIQHKAGKNQDLWQAWARLALKTRLKEEMLGVAERGLQELASQPWDFMPVATELFVRCGEFDRAEDCLRKLKQKDIEPASIAYLEGLVAKSREQNHRAIQFWRKALQLGDKSERTRLALAAVLSSTGDNQSAMLQLRTLVSEQPHSLWGHLELAKHFGQAGKLAEAAEQAYLTMQVAPGNLDAALLYIQARILLAESGEADAIEQTWKRMEEQLAELDEVTEGVFEVRLLQFQLAVRRKQFDKAEQLLSYLKTTGHNRVETALAELNLLEAKGDFDQAITILRVLLSERFPHNVLLVKYLANLLAEHGSRDDCEKLLEGELRSITDPAAKRELALTLARFYNRWKQDDKFYLLLAKLSKELADDIPIKRHLLRCEQVAKDISRSQQLVNEIRALEGADGWQWRCEQANAWLTAEDSEHRYPQIVSLLKENLSNNPDDQTSRMLLAKTYEKGGELQLAVTTYREAFNRSPEDVRVIAPTVAALYKANEYERAEEILRAASRLKLTDPELSKLEFQSCLRRGELSSAEDILEDLLAEDPNNQAICLPLALLKIRLGKYARASELLGKLKAQYPDSVPVTAALVELEVCRKNEQEALAHCNEMLKKSSNASAYILRGRAYAMLGRNDLAKEDFEQALSIEPENARAWVLKSEFDWSINRFEEAVDDIQKAMSLDPADTRVQKRAIALLLSSGRANQILKGSELLEQALSSSPRDVELWLYKSRFLLAEGTAPAIEEARRVLQRITGQQPRIADAWALWAETYLKQSQPGKAMDIVLRGLTYSPNNRVLLLLKARAEAARAPTLAIPTLRALCEREPDDIEIAMELADVYVKAGQCAKSVALLQNLLARCAESKRRRVETALAVAMYKNGDKVEADKQFHSLYQSAADDATVLLAQVEVLKDDRNWAMLSDRVSNWFQRNPRDTLTFVAIARNLAATENHSARKVSEDLLRRILDHDPDCLAAMNTLAMLLQMTGRAAESVAVYRKLVTLEPENVIAINNLAWIMCEDEGRYQQALELAQQGMRKSPAYADLIDTRGVIYYRLGEYHKAVEDFTKCLELHPKDSPSLTASYFHMARALAALGQSDRAVDNLRMSLDLNSQMGGLSPNEIIEARSLLRELLQEKNHARIAH